MAEINRADEPAARAERPIYLIRRRDAAAKQRLNPSPTDSGRALGLVYVYVVTWP